MAHKFVSSLPTKGVNNECSCMYETQKVAEGQDKHKGLQISRTSCQMCMKNDWHDENVHSVRSRGDHTFWEGGKRALKTSNSKRKDREERRQPTLMLIREISSLITWTSMTKKRQGLQLPALAVRCHLHGTAYLQPIQNMHVTVWVFCMCSNND